MTMTNRIMLRAIQAAALAALAAASAGAADAYLQLGDIEGEATTSGKDHKKWIQIDSFSWGATQSAGVAVATGDLDGDGRANVAAASDVKSPRESPSGMATGKRQHKPLTVTKEWGKDRLAKPAASGSMSFRGRVTGCAGGMTYSSATLKTAAYRYELKDVVITSCGAGGGGGSGGSLPMESISLNYSKIEIHETEAQAKDGKVKVRGWDPEKKEE